MRNIDLWGTAPGNNSPDLHCYIDPLSAAVGGILPALFGGGGGDKQTAPTPEAPPPQAPPASKPQGKTNATSASGSSCIGGIPTPPQATGQKTLLGQ